MDTIFLVDDEASIVSLAKMYLERDGFRVISAEDGLKASKRSSANSPPCSCWM